MLNKYVFTLAHEIGDMNFYPTYRRLLKNQWKSYEEHKAEQEQQLVNIINFAYRNVPFYRRLFSMHGLKPEDVRTLEDLEKLPIITKEMINENWEAFKPVQLNRIKYTTAATGGTSGTPLNYRLSNFDRFLSGAILYRGWGYGGYKLGDRMVFLAGSSLDVGLKPGLVTRAHEVARNLKKLSSFDMGDKEMREYARVINSFKPKFLRGYASSLSTFATWLELNDVKVNPPEGIFTTSEKLYPAMRKKIAEVFDCQVFDTYGLSDGGVTAFECPEHSGLHIDTERSIMEVVDGTGAQITKGEGRIVATSLYNYAMPFIRYDTTDDGYLTDEMCGCGRGYKLLKEVKGRSTDILLTPEGKHVHGWFFLYIFWEQKGIKEYQVVQESLDRIVIKLVPDKSFKERQLEEIREIVRQRSEGWTVEFQIVDHIERTTSGKFKFIVSHIDDKLTA
ncbi:putative capsular polysaccharide biosynthesis protein [Methanocella arvoryzae MRE50]|uniref:Capsular polysaccharide biosynthesis protein n=2 Tax=Methanocella TaxID=570266 RepID=Q0W3E5_METAR|nr:putative capsular polysaccharide biosynthesis protein [Methanocella arvoryzae MRE50]